MLLQTGDFEVRVDRLVGLDQIALRLEPFERVAQAAGMLHNLHLLLTDCLLHSRDAPYRGLKPDRF